MSKADEPLAPSEAPITFPINLPEMTGLEALALVAILDSVSRQIWQAFEIEMTMAILKQEGLQTEPESDGEDISDVDLDRLF